MHDAAQDRQRLLRGVAGLLPAVGADDRVPPGVGGSLAARGLLRADQPRGHVRHAIDVVVVEDVAVRVLDVDEDVVVLGRPAALRTRRRSRRPR